jgi:ResB-like family protein
MTARSKTDQSRKKRPSPVRKVLRRLGSLKLAVILLAILTVVLAMATFLEAAGGRELALWYVYNHIWFILLLAVLSLNIAAAMAARFPWKLRHAGFLLAHLGLLAVLAGSIQTFFFGMEGQVSIVEGATADTMLMTADSQISVSWIEGEKEISLGFPFRTGPVDWRDGRTEYLGESDGIAITVLKFYRYAQARMTSDDDNPRDGQGATFRSITPSDPDSSGLEGAVLIELSASGKKEKVWLRRQDPKYGYKMVTGDSRPLLITFGYDVRPLGFSLELIDFKRGKNPGGMGNASFASTVRLINKAAGISYEKEISMNSPLTHGKFTFYQSSYRDLGDREMSFLSAAYDPGRFLKYLGSVMICLGAAIMLCRRTRFFGKG